MAEIYGGARGRFKIADVELDVPPQDIDISRFENHQMVNYLRHSGSLKIPSGRSAVRIDVRFKLFPGMGMTDFDKLKRLVAMTRVTPFVPVLNQYIYDHLPLSGREGEYEGLKNKSGGAVMPMAIFGLSVMAGGDSPEVLECRMTLLYWNPNPFMGTESIRWEQMGTFELAKDYNLYIQKVIDAKPKPGDPREFDLLWFNIKSYEELLDQFGLEREYIFGDPRAVERYTPGFGQKAIDAASRFGGNQAALDQAIARSEGVFYHDTELPIPTADSPPDKIVEIMIYRSAKRRNIDPNQAVNDWRKAGAVKSPGVRRDVLKTFGLDPNDPDNLNNSELLPDRPDVVDGPVPKTNFGALQRSSQETVKSEHEDVFNQGTDNQKGGWSRIDPNDNRPLDPLFRQQGFPNVVKMTPGSIDDSSASIVTGLQINFQNRFALMPIQGHQYPSIQHMGSMDTEINISVAVKDGSEHYRVVKQIQSMLHNMTRRALKYRSKVFSGKEMFAISQLIVRNKVLANCGLDNVIITGVQTTRDPESPELVRLDLSLTENILQDERLSGNVIFSDMAWRNALVGWLEAGKWQVSKDGFDAGFIPLVKKIKALWDTAKSAYTANDNFFQNSFGAINRASRTAARHQSLVLENVERNKGFKVAMKTPALVNTQRGLWQTALNNMFIQDCEKIYELAIPLTPNDIAPRRLSSNILGALKVFYGNVDYGPSTGISDTYLKGIADKFLAGPYGEQLLNSISELRAAYSNYRVGVGDNNEDQELIEKTKNFLLIFNKAHFDWYKQHTITALLYQLSETFPEYFQEMQEEFNRENNRHVGVYRDLFMDHDVRRNPYDWLDAQVIPELSRSVDAFVASAENYRDEILYNSRTALRGIDAGKTTVNTLKAAWDFRRDKPDGNKSTADISREYENGVDLYYDSAPETISQTLSSMREIDPTQFTVRRAFPGFKLYFVEEDNTGLFKAFDDFYGYNAIIDWKLHEAQNRPATLVVTMTNLFNHLDAFVISQNLSPEARDQIAAAAGPGGQVPVINKSVEGVNFEQGVDGKTAPLQNIMLKAGTKVVLKAGYDNDPRRLTTVFAGQVTEIQAGDVMTIVCQDWTSELFSSWDPDWDNPIEEIGALERYLTSNESDPNGTEGTRMMIQAMLKQSSTRHFGAWQIGETNALGIGSENFIRAGIAGRLKEFSLEASDRSLQNIAPTIMPFETAFGFNGEIVGVDYKGRNMWEIMQELRLRHPNNILTVRPFGAGDATLVFKPRWDYYIAEDTFANGNRALLKIALDKEFEAFKEIIDQSLTVTSNLAEFDPSTGRVEGIKDRSFLDNWADSFLRWASGSAGQTNVKIPVWAILSNRGIMAELFRATGREKYYWDKLRAATGLKLWMAGSDARDLVDFGVTVTPQAGSNANTLGKVSRYFDNDKNPIEPNCTEEVKRIYFEALQDAGYMGVSTGVDRGILGYSPMAQLYVSQLRLIQQKVNQFVTLQAAKSVEEDLNRYNKVKAQVAAGEVQISEEDLKELESKTDTAKRLDNAFKESRRPVTTWHIVTSEYHIIENTMTVNEGIYNSVALGQGENTFLKYDPGLLDVRTRWFHNYAKYDKEEEKIGGFMAAQLLADEMKRMYRGEIIITGNPKIRPHDLVVVSDSIRQIFGVVEVEKVVHSMDLNHGYVTIITPAALVEVSDMTMAHAFQTFYSAMANDLELLENRGLVGRTYASAAAFALRPQNGFNISSTAADLMADSRKTGTAGRTENKGRKRSLQAIGIGGVVGYGAAAWGVGAFIVGASLAAPIAILAAGGLAIGAGLAYISFQNNALREHVKTHPLTITPVVKRGWPWTGGIQGSGGYTAIGQWGLQATKTWRDITEAIETVNRARTIIGDAATTFNDVGRITQGKINPEQ